LTLNRHQPTACAIAEDQFNVCVLRAPFVKRASKSTCERASISRPAWSPTGSAIFDLVGHLVACRG
jgi:hypothetical protein